MREKTLRRQVWQLLRGGPGFWAARHGGPFQRSGLPDLEGCLAGRFVGIELKRPGKTPTRLQAATLERIRAAGGLAFVAWATTDVIRELAAISAHYQAMKGNRHMRDQQDGPDSEKPGLEDLEDLDLEDLDNPKEETPVTPKKKAGKKTGGTKSQKKRDDGSIGVKEVAAAAGVKPSEVRQYLRRKAGKGREGRQSYRFPSLKDPKVQGILAGLKKEKQAPAKK